MESVTTSRFFIRSLRIDARIGVYQAEKAAPHPIVVDVEGALPGELACHTDCLEHTINYAAVIERLSNIALDQPLSVAEYDDRASKPAAVRWIAKPRRAVHSS